MGFLVFVLGVLGFFAIFSKPIRNFLTEIVGIVIIMGFIAAIPGGVILDIIGLMIILFIVLGSNK